MSKLFLLLFCAFGAWAQPSLISVVNAFSAGATSVTTGSLTVTAHDAIWVYASAAGNTCTGRTMTVSDSGGSNTWSGTQVGTAYLVSNWSGQQCNSNFFLGDAAAGTYTITVTFDSSMTRPQAFAALVRNAYGNSFTSCSATSSPACFSASPATNTSSVISPSFNSAANSMVLWADTTLNSVTQTADTANACTAGCTIPTNGTVGTSGLEWVTPGALSGTTITMNFSGTHGGVTARGITLNFQAPPGSSRRRAIVVN